MELSDYRKKIDSIDDKLLELFRERMTLSREIGRLKQQEHTPVLNPEREREILLRVSREAGPELGDYTRVLFQMLFELSRSYQHACSGTNPLAQMLLCARAETPELFPAAGTVACQGVEGAYSQLACDKLFKLADIMYVNSFAGVFQAVDSGLCEYGVLPIENSLRGTVGEVYDLLCEHRLYIVRGVKLHVNHELLVKPGTKLSDLRHIYSHEQALGQCSKFLKSLPGVELQLCENTAVAAKFVAETADKTIGAIASPECAQLYGLEKLPVQIRDSDHNYTRFICIAKKPAIYPGANRISITVAVPHRPGSLYRLISRFSALGVNLLKLESRPVPGRDFEFRFYLDFEASVCDAEVAKLLGELSGSGEDFVFLGNYSEMV